MTDKIKLKPCPFCGATNPIRFTCSTLDSDETRYGFYCWNCKTKGPQALSEELAAEAWNKIDWPYCPNCGAKVVDDEGSCE